MAGLWIQWEKGLVRKPEVLRIARKLGCQPLQAAGACMLVWEWAEDVTEDGVVPGMTAADVSVAAGVPGIGEAMAEAGWLVETSDAVSFPNWTRHNANPAKRRARRAQYMLEYRAEKKAQAIREREGGSTGA